jgi:hypothetical protein
MDYAEEETKDCRSLTVILAVDYGGRDEIIRAINKLLNSGIKSINEEDICPIFRPCGHSRPRFAYQNRWRGEDLQLSPLACCLH